MRMNKFYLVWNPQRSRPTVRHDSFAKAAGEAQRLAFTHVGEQFFVLESVGVAIGTASVEWSAEFEGANTDKELLPSDDKPVSIPGFSYNSEKEIK